MKMVTVAGGNMYKLALQYLGDATQWNRIAQLNKMFDPIIVGVVTLKIPSINKTATGGVLQL